MTQENPAARWLPVRRFVLHAKTDSDWQPLARGDASQRDIELKAVTAGEIHARHLRAGSLAVDLNDVATAKAYHFYWLYVLRGTMEMANGRESIKTLVAGDCVHQPGLLKDYSIDLMPGTEVLEIAVPITSASTPRPPPLHDYQPVVNIEKEVGYIQGEGLRTYFSYRDLGVAQATDDKILLHVIRATAPSPAGGTGWHRHDISQMIFVLDGWLDLGIAGHAPFRMQAGDTMCMSSDTEHVVSAFSADYATLEMCIPAHYNTVDVPLPQGY